MKKYNSVALKDAIAQDKNEIRSIIETCKKEIRELTEDEEKRVDELNKDIDDKKEELKKLQEELDSLVPQDDDDENRSDDDKPADEDDKPKEDKPADEDEPKDEDENKDENRSINKNMAKSKFSLIKTIRAVANHSEMPKESRKFVSGNTIKLPAEKRDYTVASEGEDLVVTDVYSILEPLRANNVLANAGVKFYSGLVGDVQIPVMTAQNVGWAGEIDEATDGKGEFTHITLQPKRLTAYVDLSLQFLAQDSVGAEAVIRNDIVKAVQSKLEATVLGTAAGTTTQPAGIGNGLTATACTDFDSVVNLEATLERANILGDNIKYICSPEAKAAFRAMTHGAKNNCVLAYQAGEFDGTPVLSTSNVEAKQFYVGDFSNIAVGQWDNVELIVDPYTKAASGQVRIVINAFFDAQVCRKEAIALGTFA